MNYKNIIDFWFVEVSPEQWWQKDQQFDSMIEQRFGDIHESAIKGELFSWRQYTQGRLAEIIILDQFSRNIYRDQAKAFAYDGLALILAQQAVALKEDMKLAKQMRNFIYLPYMHSESLLIHQQAVMLYKKLGDEHTYSFELKHKKIIEKFGRYPHRNQILSRESTKEELLFLQQPNSSF